jgi:hypothetical protein
MKKIYIILAAFLLSGSLLAQVGPSWWQFLPTDYETTAPERTTVKIMKVEDGFVDGFDAISEVWDAVPYEKFDIANVSNGECNITDGADMSAQGVLFFDATNLYVLYNVNDEDILPDGGDVVEMHIAPYDGQYDPGRPIYLNRKAGQWYEGTDTAAYKWGGTIILEEVYTDMALYGSWTEAGAYKSEWRLESGTDLYPGSTMYSMLGPDKDTLGDVSMGAIDVACSAIYEAKTGGYFLLTIQPLTVWKGVVPDATDLPAISIAIKVNDQDSDNGSCDEADPDAVTRSEAWGPGAVSNNAYWAVGYYGGRGEFVFDPAGVPTAKADAQSTVFFYNNQLTLNRNELVGNVSVYSITGQLVRSFDNPSETVNLSSLVEGIYVVRVTEFSGASQIVKIVR